MARKQLKFINSFLNIFKRSKKNKVAQIEESKTIVHETKQKKVKEEKESFFRNKRKEYKYGGFGDRGLGAIYFPPRRGKFKGYMRTAS